MPLQKKIDTLAREITSRFTGNGPLSSDLEMIYEELDRADGDVRDAITSSRDFAAKDAFIHAVFFNDRCCLKSVIKDEPDYLINGYLESVMGIYRKSRETGRPEDAEMSNKELAEKVATLLERGIKRV